MNVLVPLCQLPKHGVIPRESQIQQVILFNGMAHRQGPLDNVRRRGLLLL